MTAQAAAAHTPESAKAYDEVPYESYAYPQTHAQHIAAIATLFGLNPPDIKKANVLEIGCAAGINTLSQALAYPDARFVGIDISAEQIAQAEEARKALNLKNVIFRHEDILKFDTDKLKESFDYIICHGVFSWVPENVREKILEACSACLAPDGIAVVSYNTLPGWNAVRSLREMMLFHTKRFDSPKEKIAQARALLDFLAENVSEGKGGYLAIIEEERKLLKNANDTYLYHDHLEGMNTQFYLHEFVAAAHRHGLGYVGDASLTGMYLGNLPKGAMEKLKAVSDIVHQEQYMDFITNRRFRTSILCKNPGKINRNLRPEQIMDFVLAPSVRPVQPSPDPSKPVQFKTQGGATFTTNNEIAGNLFLTLCEAGAHGIAASALVSRVAEKLGHADSAAVRETLMKSGLQLALGGFFQLYLDVPEFKSEIGEKPAVYPLARWQAGRRNCSSVTNIIHGNIPASLIGCKIMPLLDGTRTLDQVTDAVTAMAEAGELTVRRGGEIVKDRTVMREEVAKAVDEIVEKLAKQALLTA